MAKNNKSGENTSRFLLKNSIMDPGLKFRVEEAYKTIRTKDRKSVV